MAALRPLLFTTALILVCFSIPLPAVSQPGPPYNPYPTYPDYSCPAGTLPLARFSLDGPPTTCDEDSCFNEAIGCGPGNACTLSRASSVGGYFYERQCQCNPPYVKGVNPGYKGLGATTSCYIPGQDKCNPNPCQNGATCVQVRTFTSNCIAGGCSQDPNGDIIDFFCSCPAGFLGTTCSLPYTTFPTPVLKNAPSNPPANPPPSGSQGFCGTGDAGSFPTRCWFNNDPQGRYVCCDDQGCNGFAGPDYLFPRCQNNGYAPPNFGVASTSNTPPSTPPANSPPSNPPPSGSQGVCGTGDAGAFPTRCWFNNDLQGRYVCCDNEGCNGFNSDNLTPHCQKYGYVPPNFGVGGSSTPPSTPPSSPPSGSQGVCGTGDAKDFPLRCWYNNDPQGRYVCCDNAGCNGFAPPDYLYPRCQNNGYVPPSL